MFGEEKYFLLNVCAFVRPKTLFPYDDLLRRLNEGAYDYDLGLKKQLCSVRAEIQVSDLDRAELFLPNMLRLASPKNRNRWIINPNAVVGCNLFVVPSFRCRTDRRMIFFEGAGAGVMFASDLFRREAKRLKLTGGKFEDCGYLNEL